MLSIIVCVCICMHIVYCMCSTCTYRHVMHDMLVWCYMYLYSYLLTAEDEKESRGTVHGSEASVTETNNEKGMSHVCTCIHRQFIPSSLAYCV